MGSDFVSETCFTCCIKPENYHKITNSDGDTHSNIRDLICQHFWFKEDDLRNAIVCETCWEKVDQFHQFYQDVQKLHGHREVTPLSMFIKQEELTIEETQLQENCIDISAENLKEFVKADCKLEITEECDELLNKEEPAEVFPLPRKKRKYIKFILSRKLPTPEEKQAEEDFIKQHTRYTCDECNIQFGNFRTIKKHRIEAHSEKNVVCCGYQYRTRALLYQHVQRLLNPEVFKCEVCGKSHKTKNNYVRHKELYHAAKEDLVFECNRCPKTFINEALLKSHLAEHETLENQTFKCEFCDKCFTNMGRLNMHVKVVHEKPMDFTCEVCSKGFHLRTMFLLHMKTHELTADQLKEQCKCKVCGRVSSNLISLKRHMRSAHAPNRKKHVCEQCGKDYSRADILKEHVAYAHTGEHLYQCQHCEKKFFSRSTLNKHRKKDHPKQRLEERVSNYPKKEEVSDSYKMDSSS